MFPPHLLPFTSLVHGWPTAVLLLKTSTEIFRAAKTCKFGNFSDGVPSFFQEPGSMFQPNRTDKLDGWGLYQSRHLLVKSRTLHTEVTCQLLHTIVRVGKVLFHQLSGMGDEGRILGQQSFGADIFRNHRFLLFWVFSPSHPCRETSSTFFPAENKQLTKICSLTANDLGTSEFPFSA